MAKLREVPVDVIDKPRVQLRSHVDEEGMEELRRSIAVRGVLVPLIVRERGERYELIAGLRRLMCASAAGVATVPAMVVAGDDEYAVWAQLAENLQREDVNALDQAGYVASAMAELGLDQAGVAGVLGMSEAWVSQRLAVLRWPKDVQEAVRAGWVGYAAGRELVGILSVKARRHCIQTARLYGCTARQAAMWRRNWLRDQNMRSVEGEGGEEREIAGEPEPEYGCLVCEGRFGASGGLVAFVCTDCRMEIERVKSGGGRE